MSAVEEHPDRVRGTETVNVVCSKNPEHKGTAIAASFTSGVTTCHSHDAPETTGVVIEPCPNDDECDGKIVLETEDGDGTSQ